MNTNTYEFVDRSFKGVLIVPAQSVHPDIRDYYAELHVVGKDGAKVEDYIVRRDTLNRAFDRTAKLLSIHNELELEGEPHR